MTPPLRSTIKSAAELLLASAPARGLARRRHRGKRLVLAYHNLISHRDSASGDASLHLSFDIFRRQLDLLERHRTRVVSIASPESEPDSEPEVAITFDDAYAGALELGVRELSDRRLPTTIFVAPGILGLAAPWWDLLATPEAKGIPGASRDSALNQLQGMHARILAAASERGWPIAAAREHFRIGTEEELRACLNRHQTLSLGAHTWSHPNLASLDAAQLDDELSRPLDWLRATFVGRSIAWLAYPYGLFSPNVERAAEQAGYSGAFRVSGGWGGTGDREFATPRFNVTAGGSLLGFEARVFGFWRS